jgi:putative DNA primase/helicase
MFTGISKFNPTSATPDELLSLEKQVNTATQFVDRLCGSHASAFATFDDKGENKTPPQRLNGSLEECLPELITLNEHGAGIFVTVNQTDGVGHKTENITGVRAVFVDLDGSPLAPVEAWSIVPHMVIETSHGRWHAYWMIEGLPLERFTEVQKALVNLFDGDPAVCDLARVMRVPGFNHHKHDPYMVTIKSIDSERKPIQAEEMLGALGLASTVTSTAPVLKLVASSATASGGRNTALTSIAGRMRHLGSPAETIEDALLTANDEMFDPALPVAEVKAIAKSVSKYPPAADPAGISNTDTGNAHRFVAQHGQDLRYVPELGKWVFWNDGVWKIDDANRAIEFAKLTAKSMFDEAAKCPTESIRTALAKHASQSLNIKRIHAMVELAKSDQDIVLPIGRLDVNDYMLGVVNGVVDLRTGKFRAAQREDFMTRRCGTIFDDTATCPNFEKFLARVTAGDVELQAYLQRLIGYALTGSVIEQCLGFLYGRGANGKSTFLVTMQRLIGDYSSQTQPETLMTKRSGGATNDIARLVGKRFVVSNEVREGSHFEENQLKQLVGEDMFTARFLYKENFDFNPKFKLMIAGNYKPVIKGDDDGIWRRVHLIPFIQTIPASERDKKLGEKLTRELPGILNWALAGCLAWQKVGLNPPGIVVDATDSYRIEMDLMGVWMNENCDVGSTHTVESSTLYNNYRSWCLTSGIKAVSAMVFGRKLVDRGIVKAHTRFGNRFQGINIKASSSFRMALVA